MKQLDIAVLLPCYNEQGAIGETIASFQEASAYGSVIYVYDNNSTDDTINEAKQAGSHSSL